MMVTMTFGMVQKLIPVPMASITLIYSALQYIDSHTSENSTKDNPFFLYFSFKSINGPLGQVRDEYLQRHLDEPNLDRRGAKAMISAVDDIIGNLVQKLKDSEIFDNTIIIFSSDHCDFVGRLNLPLRGGANFVWEGGVRVPGFVHSPLLKASAGTVTHGLLHISDWFPTIVSLAGGNIPGYIYI